MNLREAIAGSDGGGVCVSWNWWESCAEVSYACPGALPVQRQTWGRGHVRHDDVGGVAMSGVVSPRGVATQPLQCSGQVGSSGVPAILTTSPPPDPTQPHTQPHLSHAPK